MSTSAHLNLWKQQLGAVPESVWERTDLVTLVLADNGLTELPAALARIRDLRHLDLRGNPVIELPDELAMLPRLEKLDLRLLIADC